MKKIQKKLLFRAGNRSENAIYAFSAVDESVAGAVLLADIRRSLEMNRKVFIVVPRLDNAEELFRQLSLWKTALDLPWSVEMLNELQRGRFYIAGSEAERARVLALLAHGKLDVCIASLAGLLAPAPAPAALRNSEIRLCCGDEYDFTRLLKDLTALDYDDEFEVTSPGEFARRGGIVDIFSPESEYPARIEFFGNQIDSIRLFDPSTQRSLPGSVDCYTVINRCTVQTLTDEDGNAFDNTVPALTYFAADYMDCWELYPGGYAEYFERFANDGEQKIYDNFVAGLKTEQHYRIYSASEAAPDDAVNCGIFPASAHLINDLPDEAADRGRELLARQWQLQIRQWAECGYSITAVGNEEASPRRLKEYFAANGLDDIAVDFACMPIPGGLLNFAAQSVIITENELLAGLQSSRRGVKNLCSEVSAAEHEVKLENAVIADLEESCHAVHAAHGIALYKGLKVVEDADGSQREVMILEYHDNALLQVPIHQAASVSRYIGGGRISSVKLHRLGGTKWSKDKLNTTEAVHQYAAEMLRLQAVRASAPGLPVTPNELAESEFAARFRFNETADQLRSISEVQADLEAEKPMDRLLCGDVGYGKTEIAMRAAFKMVEAGYQVAMIVPTTVLAQQHYVSFLERFTTYPYTIEVLSRFRSNAEQQSVISRLASGGVDIVIGTHRLASADIAFKNLGLVIIDEEQRFGVKVKDRLLRMRANVNVLTMSATPIPRTLYLSMAGARQLSTIMTAPVERLPVKTIVMREDDNALVQAITDEIARGGQVYFLHNRVRSIKDRFKKLSALMPEVTFGVAHGQMPEDELEDVMKAFVDGKVQVLLCTTIIESGLDMPNANTIIIERADRFGLAELYQLRGRVGRWKRQAYAYLVIPDQSYITPDGRKRIAAIRRCTQLGAGMKLALRDLEIRGAGNLLGSEQSGHITAVGFELYCQLLKQEIALLKNEKVRQWLPDVDLNIEFIRYGCRGTDKVLAAGLPLDYIEADRLRLAVFRTLAHLTCEEEVAEFRLELIDRFGKLPPEVENLMIITVIKILAAQAGFSSLTVSENRILLRKRAADTYRSNGKIPRLKEMASPTEKLHALLRMIRLIALENGG